MNKIHKGGLANFSNASLRALGGAVINTSLDALNPEDAKSLNTTIEVYNELKNIAKLHGEQIAELLHRDSISEAAKDEIRFVKHQIGYDANRDPSMQVKKNTDLKYGILERKNAISKSVRASLYTLNIGIQPPSGGATRGYSDEPYVAC